MLEENQSQSNEVLEKITKIRETLEKARVEISIKDINIDLKLAYFDYASAILEELETMLDVISEAGNKEDTLEKISKRLENLSEELTRTIQSTLNSPKVIEEPAKKLPKAKKTGFIKSILIMIGMIDLLNKNKEK